MLKKFKARLRLNHELLENGFISLGFEYKDVKKNVFVDGHEQPDVVEDGANFLNLKKNMEPY